MTNFKLFILTGMLGLASLAQARTPHAQITFEQKPHPENVFSVNDPAVAYYSYTYSPYSTWLDKGSGKAFPMDVAPGLTGLVSGKIQTPPVQPINEADYKEQAGQFARVVNERNRQGRPKIDLAGKTPAEALQKTLKETYVVEITLSAVVDKPLQDMNLTPDRVSHLPELIDVDNFHFQIPGSFVDQVLEEGHAGFAGIRPDRTYLLSVFDMREYNCAVMKDRLRDYFSKKSEKEQLKNESIYLISQLSFNQPSDFAQVQKLLGKRPDAVIQQQAIYADHLIRADETVFAFFAEGNKTRVVLLSNIAMKSEYFTGAKGLIIRQYLLDGITGGALGTVTGGAIAVHDKLSDLLSGATSDVAQKNACNRGVALGLIRYSQSLFNEFINFTVK